MCGVGVTREGRCADGMADVLTVTFFPYQERDGLGGLAVARGRGRGRGDWSLGTPGSVQEITYTVPADKCGLVIGKGKRQLSGFLSLQLLKEGEANSQPCIHGIFWGPCLGLSRWSDKKKKKAKHLFE